MKHNVVVISGSHRQESQSLKIANVIAEKLRKREEVNALSVLDLASANLPFWKESYTEEEQAILSDTQGLLKAADAFVVISPEWNGMITSALKNVFLLYSADVFAHKPGLIASVSAGVGGSYPITELRSSTYKNSRICYLPEHLIFRDVGKVFNSRDEDDKHSENYMSGRTDYCLELLLAYSKGLSKVRQDVPMNKQFTNGM